MRRLVVILVSWCALAVVLTAQADRVVTGAISSTMCPGTGCVRITNLSGSASASLHIGGTWSGNLLFNASLDCTTFDVPITVYAAASNAALGPSASFNLDGLFTPAAFCGFEVRADAWTSGTATIIIRASDASLTHNGAVNALQNLDAAVAAGLSVTQTALSAIRLTDRVNGYVGVAPSSTPAPSTVGALVVGLSPNSPLPVGTNAIGSITNTSFGISGTLPAFTTTPTVNLGTIGIAATAANQTTGNTSLSSLDTKTPALGQATMANSRPVVIANNQSAVTVATTGDSTVNIPSGGFDTGIAVAGWDDANNQFRFIPITNGGYTVPASLTNADGSGPVETASTTPSALAIGLIVRNIPSGTQTVSGTVTTTPPANASTNVAQMAGTTVSMNTGTRDAGTQRVTIATNDSVPVTGPLTDTQLRASAVPVSLTSTTVTNFPATQAVTQSGTWTPLLGQPARTTGTLTSTTCPGTGCVSVATTNYATVTVTVNGTYSLTVGFEFSDDGTNFYSTQCTRTDLDAHESTSGAIVNLTRAWDCSVYGSTSFRVRATAFTSGTANVGLTLSTASIETAPTVGLAAGTNLVGGINNAQVNGATIAVQQGVADAGTQRFVMATEATYAASTTLKTATAAGTAAFFELCGSATKTVRVQRIAVSGTVATAAIYGDLTLRKNSSAATGGTATTLTNTPYDSNSAAATATAKYFTVLPTGGATLVGVILAITQFFPLTGTAALTPAPFIYQWRDQDAEAPTLRGVAQCLTIGFGTTPTNAPTLTVSVAWTEK